MYQGNRSNKRNRANSVKVTFANGAKANLFLDTIPESDWRTHHGTAADGTIVRSAKSFSPKGTKSTLIANGKGDVISIDNADLEILVKDLNKIFGSQDTVLGTSRVAQSQ